MSGLPGYYQYPVTMRGWCCRLRCQRGVATALRKGHWPGPGARVVFGSLSTVTMDSTGEPAAA
jgi:hypothetical protein